MKFRLVESFNILRAYHGSPFKFNQFSLSNFGNHDAGQYGKGIYLTNSREVAKGFTEGKGGYIYTCNLSLDNPLIIQANEPQEVADLVISYGANKATEILQQQGYDGIIVKNDTLYNPDNIFEKIIADQYIIFNPKDIDIIKIEHMRFKLVEILNLDKINSLQKGYKNSDMYKMIEEAKNRGIRVEDIFKKKSPTVNPLTFFNDITEDTEENYQLNAFKRIFLNKDYNIFYQTLLGYLDNKPNYPKLDPALVRYDKGTKKYKAEDGRHRAAFCILLNIPLPVEKR